MGRGVVKPDSKIRNLFRRVLATVRQRPLASGVGAIAIVAGLSWLAFGYFGIHTLFIDEKVNEANPFVAGAGPSGLAADETTAEMADAMNDAMDESGVTGPLAVDEPMDAGVATLAEGAFVGRSHPTSGRALVITDGDRRFLRFEGFETDNGPDLNVYLATGPPDGSPGDFIDLGDLKGNIGDQNYEIPEGANLSSHATVFIWCVRFGVAFGAAPLA